MTYVAGIRDLQRVGLDRRDKMKRMTADVYIRDGLLDLRHVTGDALTAGTAGLVVRVRLDRGRVRPVLRIRTVANSANLVDWLSEHRLVRGAVRVMA